MAEHSEDWLLFLRNIGQYTVKLHTAYEEERNRAQTLELQLAGKESVIQYQKEQLATDQKTISRLEVEKDRLATAAAPAVLTGTAFH